MLENCQHALSGKASLLIAKFLFSERGFKDSLCYCWLENSGIGFILPCLRGNYAFHSVHSRAFAAQSGLASLVIRILLRKSLLFSSSKEIC